MLLCFPRHISMQLDHQWGGGALNWRSDHGRRLNPLWSTLCTCTLCSSDPGGVRDPSDTSAQRGGAEKPAPGAESQHSALWRLHWSPVRLFAGGTKGKPLSTAWSLSLGTTGDSRTPPNTGSRSSCHSCAQLTRPPRMCMPSAQPWPTVQTPQDATSPTQIWSLYRTDCEPH